MAEFTDVPELVDGVRSGDRTMLGRAITLVESTRPDHRELAAELLAQLVGPGVSSHRVGITGVPGVGKSTFIESLGVRLTGEGHHVAVLTVDPTSSRTGGSILGDKTRMPRLATDPGAFIRPSPSSGTLGGVTRSTRESIVVLEAAGYDIVLVETVGVGQSETVVHGMVDFFLVLMLAGAGDELQGIKKGVLELADMVVVNKADGDNEVRARASARDYAAALHLLAPASPNWSPPVLTCSGLHDIGLDVLWQQVEQHRQVGTESGEFAERRRRQQVAWMWSMLDDRLRGYFRTNPGVQPELATVDAAVLAGEMLPSTAVDRLLAAFSR
ncbi:MAG: methylmalonyl Co-A mutase-associated GTPase MeaB [Acidimicrobiales bacterium]